MVMKSPKAEIERLQKVRLKEMKKKKFVRNSDLKLNMNEEDFLEVEKIKEFLSERSLKEYQNEGILKSTDTYTINSTEFTLPPINNYTPKGFGKRTPQPMFSFNI